MSGDALLPPDLRLGPVELTVADLPRSLGYYREVLGLRVHRHEGAEAELGDGETVLVKLLEQPGAGPPGRSAGLFHFALLYPSREELGRALARIARAGEQLTGASDHSTHEALYLRDPDGHGIELAADRPREAWPVGLGYDRGPAPLDLDGLVTPVAGEEPAATAGPGLAMGHLHLHVGDIASAVRFYRDIVGFELQADLGTAVFLSAGGYHHHLACNVWNGEGAGPPPPGAAILRHWTAMLGSDDAVAALAGRVAAAGLPAEAAPDGGVLVTDPWRTTLRVTAAG